MWKRLRDELQSRQSDAVEVVETHISWVFLTDDRALKLKKPVRFNFLDFSTADRRRAACEEEVRLNRRLAPNVYHGVSAIEIAADGALRLVGDQRHGSAVDWVVRMRRLPAEGSLKRLIESGAVAGDHVQRIANQLAAFYGSLPPALDADGYRARFESLVRDNRQTLLESADESEAARIKRIHGAQLRFLQFAGATFARRFPERIVEGHGDLRPEHVYFAPDPAVIDCIEFNADMRCVDVADELAFLAMECEMLGAANVGKQIADKCLAQIGDHPPAELVCFYKSYRACVRAKVAALRVGQLNADKAVASVDEARRYLASADLHAERLGAPLLLVVRGLMGAGKSTLAAVLADSLGAELLQTDAIRREQFAAGDDQADYGQGIYDEANRRRVYEKMFARADVALGDGMSVVLDGAFLAAELRRTSATIAAKHGARFLIVQCRCSDDVMRRRIAERQRRGDSDSDARPELLDYQRGDEEPLASDEPHCNVDTTRPPEELQTLVLKRLGADPQDAS